MWHYTKEGYGLAPIRREGQKVDVTDYLNITGEYPPRDFYSDAEYAQLVADGWEWVEE